MNLNYLETFLHVSETLSFSKSAIRLKVAQPAVSRQIKLLEQQLGHQLFIRDRQKVRLSPEGEKLKRRIGPLLAGIIESVTRVHDEGTSLEGLISIGSVSESGEKIFLPLINSFKKEHPEVDFKVKFLKIPEIIERVKNGTLDFGIIPVSVDTMNIRAYRLLKEESVLVTRTSNNMPLDLRKVSFVVYREEDPLLESFFKKNNIRIPFSKIKFGMIVNSYKAIIDTLHEHDFYAVLPRFTVENEIKNGLLKIASPKKVESNIYLIHYENDLMENRKKVFRDYILSASKAWAKI
jgi:DNA-binding transcriptional LysR family regulator